MGAMHLLSISFSFALYFSVSLKDLYGKMGRKGGIKRILPWGNRDL